MEDGRIPGWEDGRCRMEVRGYRTEYGSGSNIGLRSCGLGSLLSSQFP